MIPNAPHCLYVHCSNKLRQKIMILSVLYIHIYFHFKVGQVFTPEWIE